MKMTILLASTRDKSSSFFKYLFIFLSSLTVLSSPFCDMCLLCLDPLGRADATHFSAPRLLRQQIRRPRPKTRPQETANTNKTFVYILTQRNPNPVSKGTYAFQQKNKEKKNLKKLFLNPKNKNKKHHRRREPPHLVSARSDSSRDFELGELGVVRSVWRMGFVGFLGVFCCSCCCCSCSCVFLFSVIVFCFFVFLGGFFKVPWALFFVSHQCTQKSLAHLLLQNDAVCSSHQASPLQLLVHQTPLQVPQLSYLASER